MPPTNPNNATQGELASAQDELLTVAYKAVDEVERLRPLVAQIALYAEHRLLCNRRDASQNYECSCGLDALLAASPSEPASGQLSAADYEECRADHGCQPVPPPSGDSASPEPEAPSVPDVRKRPKASPAKGRRFDSADDVLVEQIGKLLVQAKPSVPSQRTAEWIVRFVLREAERLIESEELEPITEAELYRLCSANGVKITSARKLLKAAGLEVV